MLIHRNPSPNNKNIIDLMLVYMSVLFLMHKTQFTWDSQWKFVYYLHAYYLPPILYNIKN